MTDTQPRTPAGSPVGGQFAAKPGGAESDTSLALSSTLRPGAALIAQLPEDVRAEMASLAGYEGQDTDWEQAFVCRELVGADLLPENFCLSWDRDGEGDTTYQLCVYDDNLPHGYTWLSTDASPKVAAGDLEATGLAAAAAYADVLIERAAELTAVAEKLKSVL